MSQMDDDDLDQLGRMAAAHTRAEARAMADSPSALRELLARESAAPSAEPTVVPVAHTRAVERPRWKLAAVAAAVGVLALGLGWALVNGFGGTIDIVAPAGTGAGLPGGSAAPATSTPGTTSPENTTPGPVTSTPQSTAPGPTSVPVAPPVTAPTTTVPEALDPIAQFGEIDTQPLVSLETVPRLLPGAPFDPARTDRIEYEMPGEEFRLQQTWVRAGTDGIVDAVVTATTERGLNRLGTPIAIAGWPDAVQNLTDDGSVLLHLNSEAGTVQLNTRGLDLAEVVAIAASLTIDDGSSSWRSELLAPPDWTVFDQGWRAGAAVRTLVERGTDGLPQTELVTSVGVPVLNLGLPVAVGDARLVDVAGQPAVATSGTGIESLVLLDRNGAALAVATRGAPESLIELVTSLTEVDQTTWDSSSSPPGEFDGCLGLIC